VKAFARIGNEPILVHSQVYNPDYVIVLDPFIHKIVDVTEGLKEGGIVLINTAKKPEETGLRASRVATVDATGIALELNLLVAGFPIVNTSILGAFSKATEEVKLENILNVVKDTWAGSVGEKNAKAAELAYERLLRGW